MLFVGFFSTASRFGTFTEKIKSYTRVLIRERGSRMETVSICLFCGKNPAKGSHEVCKTRLTSFREDLRKTPARDKWKVFQAAEHGHYGDVPLEALIPERRPPGRKPQRAMKPKKTKTPDFRPRMLELLNDGLLHREIVKVLNEEGFRSAHGLEITFNTLSTSLYNLRKRAGV
jgi:hypothetical protein